MGGVSMVIVAWHRDCARPRVGRIVRDFRAGVQVPLQRLALQVALKDVGMFDFILVYMISANCTHGPFQDDGRYHQVRDAMKAAYEQLDERAPLFATLAADISEELKRGGHTWPYEKPLEAEVWEFAKSQDPFTKKGYRLNLNRFMGVVEVAKDEVLPRWSLSLWERTFVCLEADMLRGKGVQRLILRSAPNDEFGEGGGSTNSGRVSVKDRTLRSCLQNALVTSVMFMGDAMNKRRLEVFAAVSEHLRRWHGAQSVMLRSSEKSWGGACSRSAEAVSPTT